MTDKLRDAVQLLPCPFCGGKPAIGNNRHTVTKEGHHIQEIVKWETWINCPHCQFAISSGCIDVASRGNAIAYQETLERATQMWNTRAPSAQQDAQAVPLTEKQRVYLAQSWAMLEDYAADQRQAGNDSIADGADASAHEIKLMLNAAPTPPAQKKHKPLFAEMIAQHPGLAEELAQQDAQAVPIAMKTHGAWDGLELLDGLPDGTCLYAAPTPPAQRVMLTDEEISRIYTEQTGAAIEDSPWALNDFVRAAIEAYDRKNGTK